MSGSRRRFWNAMLAAAILQWACNDNAVSAQPLRSAVPHSYAAHVAEAARRFGLPEHWIRAVLRQESGGNVGAISHAGAMGLMQIMPPTWNELRARHALGTDPFDPRDNIIAGAAYLRDMYDRYGASGMLAAYNAGPGRYETYLRDGRPLPRETQTYLRRLLPFIGAEPAASPSDPARPPAIPWMEATLFPARGDVGASAIEARSDRDLPLVPSRAPGAASSLFVARTERRP